MYKIKVSTLEELNVIEKSLEEFNRIMERHAIVEDFLKNKKFQIGDYVIKNVASYFDNVFGNGGGMVGKIVDWDFDNNYYRVYFNKDQPYQGVEEDQLDRYVGEVSSELYVKQAREIKRIIVNL